MTKSLFHLRQFRLLLLFLLCALFSLPLSARKEAYVVKSWGTLTFYYDKNRYSNGDDTWGIDEKSDYYSPAWAGTDDFPNEWIKKVVFDASFKDFRPITTERWFYYLSALTTIEGLENLNTSAVTDMRGMFAGCYSLTSLNLSNFNTSAVTDMSMMFSGCSRLTSLNISSFNTSKVTKMSDMFEGCSGLKELNVSNFNTSKVTSMAGMFSRCSGLTSLNLSNFNTSKVTDMSGMFSGCSGLTELNVSNFNTSAVKNMSGMFSSCYSLKRILNTKTWRCEKSQDMFSGCTQLKGAVKYDRSKNDITMANPDTGYFADSNPRAYVQQSEDQQTLTFYYDVNRAFRSGKTWGINEKSSSSTPVWAGIYSTANKAVTKVVFDASFKDFRPTTTEGWFYHLSALTTIEGLENLNTSAVTDMSAMFFHCSSLTSLNLSNFNTSAVTDMSAMFYGCSGLTELNVSNFNTSKVTVMTVMFDECRSLTSLNISNFNTSAVTHMNSMFSGCSSLKELDVSSFNTSAVKNMSLMFAGCSSLRTILNANTWRCDNSINMFAGCTQLIGSVKFDYKKLDDTMANPTTGYFTDPNGKEAYVLQSEDQHTLTFYYDNNRKLRSGKAWYIAEKSSSSTPIWAGTYEHPNNVVTKVVFDASFKDFRPSTTSSWFYNLKALTTIEGLQNLNTSAVTNMGNMFYGCSGLKDLDVSNFNTSAVTNMRNMFSGCYGLTSLNVSNFNTYAVTSMHAMFSGCSGLTELHVSNFYTPKVTDMSEMFYGCSGLTSLNVSRFNTSAVKNISEMFTNCSGLKTIINPDIWRCDNSRNMFYGCTQLKGAVKYDASKLDVTMANPTTGYFTVPNREYPKAYVLQSEDQHTLTFYYDNNRKFRSGKTWDIDEKSSSSKPVWTGTHGSPNNVVTKVVFDASFKDFRPTTTNSWFSYLKALTTIEGLENLNTSAVTNMSEMFKGCSGLKELNVSNFNTSAVTNMSLMFSGCSGLKELNVSNFNTSKVTNMSKMFSGCSGLKTILNPNTWQCEQSQDMFEGCTQLKGAVKYDASKLDVTMANPTTGYFSQKLPTAIGRVAFDDNNATQIYNLQGKRVNANQRHLPAGFYIVNGKKVYLNEKP